MRPNYSLRALTLKGAMSPVPSPPTNDTICSININRLLWLIKKKMLQCFVLFPLILPSLLDRR